MVLCDPESQIDPSRRRRCIFDPVVILIGVKGAYKGDEVIAWGGRHERLLSPDGWLYFTLHQADRHEMEGHISTNSCANYTRLNPMDLCSRQMRRVWVFSSLFSCGAIRRFQGSGSCRGLRRSVCRCRRLKVILFPGCS